MAFKKVSGAKKYHKYTEKKPGDVLVEAGTFVGTEEGKFGVQHVFREKSGELVVLNSAGHLNWLIDNYVKPGQVCNVVYAERKMLTKGAMAGKEAHTFELAIDDEPLTPPPVAAAAAGGGSLPPDDDITL